MKTIVEINSINYSSTGNITLNIASALRNNGYKVYTACKNSRMGKRFEYNEQVFIGYWFERIISERLAAFNGNKGHYNILSTKSFLNKLDEIKPDLIHLHLLHDTYINLDMLFKYIKKNNIPIVWTFHDCWAFTGQCSYFDTVECDKWKTGCHDCPQTDIYPSTYFIDKTNKMWNEKKQYFNNVKNMTIVTPSIWLKNHVSESYMHEYPCVVIYNGINLDIFKPTESDFRKQYNLEDKKILLGVSYGWSHTKGFDVFIELAKRLPSNYQIVLVGGSDDTDKLLPDNIISIHKTYNQEELVKIYSAADLFVNPTRQDNFPTVNIEALACGTPIVCFNTGGCPEIITDKCGSVVAKNDIGALEKEIIRICEENPYQKLDCIKRGQEFDMNIKYQEYVELIGNILGNS